MRYRHKLSTPIGAQHFLSSFNKKKPIFIYIKTTTVIVYSIKERKKS